MARKEKDNQDLVEYLFEDFYQAARGTFASLESRYGVQGLVTQVFGGSGDPVAQDEEQEKKHFRQGLAWTLLSKLYEYAVNGIEPVDGDTMALVIDGSDVIKLAASENHWPDEKWADIGTLGDARYALDEGRVLTLRALALLANVDIRTVRNAVSSGELVTHKSEGVEEPYVDNATARRWLQGRRGFKPTVRTHDDKGQQLAEVATPQEFGHFLAQQRAQLSEVEAARPVQHAGVTEATLTELERGVFTLPLDAVFPVADYYQLERKSFLQCVMRVFFRDELSALTE